MLIFILLEIKQLFVFCLNYIKRNQAKIISKVIIYLSKRHSAHKTNASIIVMVKHISTILILISHTIYWILLNLLWNYNEIVIYGRFHMLTYNNTAFTYFCRDATMPLKFTSMSVIRLNYGIYLNYKSRISKV